MGEVAVPVAVVGGVAQHVVAHLVHHIGQGRLGGLHPHEAPPRQEVLRGLAVQDGGLVGHQLVLLIEAVEPEREPAAAGLHDAHPQVGELVQDAAHGEVHHGQHGPERVGEGVLLQPGVVAVDHDGHLVGGLAATVDAHRGPVAVGHLPHHIVGRVVQVAIQDVLGGHHAHEHAGVLGEAPLQLGGGPLGVDHGQLGHQLEAGRVVGRVGGPGVVQQPTQLGGETGIAQRPLLPRAGREHDGHVDALEVHVGDTGAGHRHPLPLKRRLEIQLAGGVLPVVPLILGVDRRPRPRQITVDGLHLGHVLHHLRPPLHTHPMTPPRRLPPMPISVHHKVPILPHPTIVALRGCRC